MSDSYYMYAADLWCESCGEGIRKQLNLKMKEGEAIPEDENLYDSDDYPKGPYPVSQGEADIPEHCGSMEECLEAEVLSSGRKVGKLLGIQLTAEGIQYVKDIAASKLHEDQARDVVEFWAEYYDIDLEENSDE